MAPVVGACSWTLPLVLVLWSGAATAQVSFVLPEDQSPSEWRDALALVDMVPVTQAVDGPHVELRRTKATWLLRVRDASGALRETPVPTPRSEADRQDIGILAFSLLQPTATGPTALGSNEPRTPPPPVLAPPEPEPIAAAPAPPPRPPTPKPEPLDASPDPEPVPPPEPAPVTGSPEPAPVSVSPPEPVAAPPDPEPVAAPPDPEPVAAPAPKEAVPSAGTPPASPVSAEAPRRDRLRLLISVTAAADLRPVSRPAFAPGLALGLTLPADFRLRLELDLSTPTLSRLGPDGPLQRRWEIGGTLGVAWVPDRRVAPALGLFGGVLSRRYPASPSGEPARTRARTIPVLGMEGGVSLRIVDGLMLEPLARARIDLTRPPGPQGPLPITVGLGARLSLVPGARTAP